MGQKKPFDGGIWYAIQDLKLLPSYIGINLFAEIITAELLK